MGRGIWRPPPEPLVPCRWSPSPRSKCHWPRHPPWRGLFTSALTPSLRAPGRQTPDVHILPEVAEFRPQGYHLPQVCPRASQGVIQLPQQVDGTRRQITPRLSVRQALKTCRGLLQDVAPHCLVRIVEGFPTDSQDGRRGLFRKLRQPCPYVCLVLCTEQASGRLHHQCRCPWRNHNWTSAVAP